jgi:hypothetical protein
MRQRPTTGKRAPGTTVTSSKSTFRMRLSPSATNRSRRARKGCAPECWGRRDVWFACVVSVSTPVVAFRRSSERSRLDHFEVIAVGEGRERRVRLGLVPEGCAGDVILQRQITPAERSQRLKWCAQILQETNGDKMSQRTCKAPFAPTGTAMEADPAAGGLGRGLPLAYSSSLTHPVSLILLTQRYVSFQCSFRHFINFRQSTSIH